MSWQTGSGKRSARYVDAGRRIASTWNIQLSVKGRRASLTCALNASTSSTVAAARSGPRYRQPANKLPSFWRTIAGGPSSTTNPQLRRSATPAGSLRCSRRRLVARDASAPAPIPSDRVKRSTADSPLPRGGYRRVRRRCWRMGACMRDIEVATAETAKVQHGHLRLLLRDPDHRAVHDGEPERRDRHCRHMDADDKEQREDDARLYDHDRRLRTRE